MMDVATNDTVKFAFGGFTGDGVFVFKDITDGFLDLVLDRFGQ
jgi:hypothetical protein